VAKNDNMPSMVCSLCADKINDFYEFREMCKTTNTQTRLLLGLPPEEKENFQDEILRRKKRKFSVIINAKLINFHLLIKKNCF